MCVRVRVCARVRARGREFRNVATPWTLDRSKRRRTRKTSGSMKKKKDSVFFFFSGREQK